ncbi:hypothetical protein [Aquimarina rubra]|uniref:Uncharacterized protein n=1 Tax=Aquimarina rubra TaxID=1920033 RepID=A0ABW5LKA3_9FLAO
MKLQILMMIALIWIGQSTFGQTTETKNNSTDKNSQNKTAQAKGTLITNISEQGQSPKNNDIYYSEQEWKKIKQEIRKNRKRITNSKDGIHTSKILDTIYLEIKIPTTNSQITDW